VIPFLEDGDSSFKFSPVEAGSVIGRHDSFEDEMLLGVENVCRKCATVERCAEVSHHAVPSEALALIGIETEVESRLRAHLRDTECLGDETKLRERGKYNKTYGLGRSWSRLMPCSVPLALVVVYSRRSGSCDVGLARYATLLFAKCTAHVNNNRSLRVLFPPILFSHAQLSTASAMSSERTPTKSALSS
jgi:hypothetical protein